MVEVLDEAIDFARRRGLRWQAAFLYGGRVTSGFELGRFDDLLRDLGWELSKSEVAGSVLAQLDLRSYALRATTIRGRLTDRVVLEELESTARSTGDVESISTLAAAVPAHVLHGDVTAAHDLLVELLPTIASGRGWWWVPRMLPSLVRAAVEIDEVDLAERLANSAPCRMPIDDHARVAGAAIVAEAHGDLQGAAPAYRDAADGWRSFEIVPEAGYAALGEGRSLARLGRTEDAVVALDQARTIFSGLGATPLVDAVDRLMRDTAVA